MRDQSLGPRDPTQRRDAALRLRVQMAHENAAVEPAVHRNNHDDDRYRDYRGSYTKGFEHDPNTGLIASPEDYRTLRRALASGQPTDFASLRIHGDGSSAETRRFVNPQAGLGFEMMGADAQHFGMPPAPAFESREQAAEISENYWMAMLRDIHFDSYAGNPVAKTAARCLNAYGDDLKAPKQNGKVTPENLFRGLLPGDLYGPYISQFLMLPVPFGTQGFDQRMLTTLPGHDFGQHWDEYIEIQNGKDVGLAPDQYAKDPVYIRNGRDLGQWVHIDVLFQAYFNAMLILHQGPRAPTPLLRSNQAAAAAPHESGLSVHDRSDFNTLTRTPDSPTNPYLHSFTEGAFGTLGSPWVAATVCEVATRALRAVWFQKWYVHRRLRPEAFAARIHAKLSGKFDFDLDESLNPHNETLRAVAEFNASARSGAATGKRKTGKKTTDCSYLLPLAFPEGSPMHPAYGAGHATVAGACVTVLKAFFDETAVIAHPKRVSSDGRSLKDYVSERKEPPLTVGGELNKLASNVAIGRNIAGVHWRSDGTESLRLGEAVAIAYLREHRRTFNEAFEGFRFTGFDGGAVEI